MQSSSSLLFTSSFSPPSIIPRSRQRSSIKRTERRAGFLPFSRLRFPGNVDFKVVRGVRFDVPIVDMRDLEEIEDVDLVVETCVTRTLPPALTLERGLQSIKEAVDELKLNSPPSSSGVMRFQVAVPPSAKALYWFCCQPEASGVFPLFFLSKETDVLACKSLYLNRTHGVFGAGAAISFVHSSSHHSKEQSKMKRYMSDDSSLITAYGFSDVKFGSESAVKREAGSFYFFIPQIELDEHEDLSILAVTLAWNNSLSCRFEQAIRSYETSLHQATFHFWGTTESCQFRYIRAALSKLNIKENQTGQMEYMNFSSLAGRDFGADTRELRTPSSSQFCCKLSPRTIFANNMLDHTGEVGCSLKDQPNINAVWAAVIVEECTRLGLTYFCVAPGSRSSPLAIAAATHPLATCIACFDERSLAFHAVGYARGSLRPAVIITSSGTAVSNLLPAVVEASEDFLPLLLLTADRPPELQDAGANQAINQVDHFGSFVRFFFNLPTPTDLIPVRMVLTTLDSAVHWASSSPCGPVHLNCPFREPLDGSPKKWSSDSLSGLDMWMSNAGPFTKYFQVGQSFASKGDIYGQMEEIFEIIQGAEKGLLLAGAIHTEDEIWAVLLLARELLWPVVADILSGLRLRKLFSSFPEVKENILFVDHLDHALLSDSVRQWAKFDVVIQVGSRITSKRVSRMLEECFPFSYILVDKHPHRHDPSHLVTHRIQSSIVQFVDCVLGSRFPRRRSEWHSHLQALDSAVAWEISFQTSAECSLTEPYVAHILSKALTSKSALFIGNSMPIRDADIYGRGWENNSSSNTDMLLSSELPCHWIQVTGNRGASGIDGLLSTAVGFAEGCKKRVFCVIGDISFLHDTNGLAILSYRTLRKPMTVLVINNHGGGIFRLLPVADRTEQRVLNQYFYTSHNISIEKLCMAHGLKYQNVRTKSELQNALFASQQEEMDCIIEVESCIDANAKFHSILGRFARQAADHALRTISTTFHVPTEGFLCQIHSMKYSLYRIELCDRPTSNYVDNLFSKFYREGFILSLTLDDGSIGYGEVAPLEIHKENLIDVEEQLCFLLHVMKGANIGYMLPLLKGSFSSWIQRELGIPVASIFPSVRCGLEMALLNAIMVRQGSTLLSILDSRKEVELSPRSSSVQICALLHSEGTPSEVAYVASKLVEEGFAAIKLKVARRVDPAQDAAVIQEIRRVVGHQIELRADANRKWSYEEALKFSSLTKNCNLQYIEEPVQNEDDLIKYCEESGLPVALDETLDNFRECHMDTLIKYAHQGIVAVVIKPSVVGGLENAALIARWAQLHGKLAVISAAYESGLGLSAYILLSSYLELQNLELSKEENHELLPRVAHGLGTYRWLREDVLMETLGIRRNPSSGFIEAFVAEANKIMQRFKINEKVILRSSTGELVHRYMMRVDMEDFSFSINVCEVGQGIQGNVVLFLHGFLGTGEEWIPIMKAISGSARCFSVDIPGHGSSGVQSHGGKMPFHEPSFSMEMIADALCKLIHQITPGKVTLVGYSMGARIALYMAMRFSNKINGAVVVSGSPGLKNPVARKIQRAKDDSKARAMVAYGLQVFLENWYCGGLWKSLRSHPHFSRIVASRLLHDDVRSVAKVLSDLSSGRQPSLWKELKQCNTNILLVFGEKDTKFKQIAMRMHHEMSNSEERCDEQSNNINQVVEIPDAGHAVHLENPLTLINAVRKFLMRAQENSALSQKALVS